MEYDHIFKLLLIGDNCKLAYSMKNLMSGENTLSFPQQPLVSKIVCSKQARKEARNMSQYGLSLDE